MTIYTDGVHLVTDAAPDYAELHAFAAKIALRPSWFQGDHYDLTTRNAAMRAVAAGAVLIDMRDLGRLTIRLRRLSGRESVGPTFCRLELDWAPTPLDPCLAADKNTELMRCSRQAVASGAAEATIFNAGRPPRDARPENLEEETMGLRLFGGRTVASITGKLGSSSSASWKPTRRILSRRPSTTAAKRWSTRNMPSATMPRPQTPLGSAARFRR